jgi:hypothetical protein
LAGIRSVGMSPSSSRCLARTGSRG